MASNFLPVTSNPHVAPQIRTICLRIICKSFMNKGFCYLGLEEATQRIFRPISNTSPQNCCWPSQQNNQCESNINTEYGESSIVFEVGQLIEFQILHHPDDNSPKTPYPHRNEDLVVTVTCLPQPVPWVITASSLPKNNIFDIFPESVIKDFKYVDEDTVCPSAGILHTMVENVQRQPDGKRAIIKQSSEETVYTFDFPVTAVSVAVPPVAVSCLVILGLGRPWAGSYPTPFNPKRCYILIVGIVYLQN